MYPSLRPLAPFTLALALALVCVGASSPPAPGAYEYGSGQEDEERAVAARERYLLTNPWHPRVFREYRDLLVKQGAVDARADALAARARAGEQPAGVLAARLWAGAGELDRALEALVELELESDPRAALLRAEWLLRAARGEEAARETERALSGLPAGEERERALRLALALALQNGARDEGERAFARLVDELPNELDLRLELVDELLRAGWISVARAGLDEARELAAGDPEAEVAVLLGEARIAAALGDAVGSANAQRAALERLGRDHWRRAGVRARAFEAARAAGTLEAWRDELAEDVEEGGALAAFEDWAAAEVQLGRPDVAWEVLENAAALHGGDDALRAGRLALARRTGRTEESLALLQDEVERHGRLAASLELADALCEAGRVEAARVQWDRCAAEARDDAEQLAEIARLRARHGEDDAVLALLERVADLASERAGVSNAALVATLELARHHARNGRVDVARSTLDAAAAGRASDAVALEELGAVQLEIGEAARAEALWRAALARSAEAESPDDVDGSARARLARRLARLLQDEGRRADARAALLPFVETELRSGRGSVTLAQLLTTFRRREDLARAAEREARRALSGEGGRTAWHLAAEGRARTGDVGGAIELWRLYLDSAPEDLAALESLGELEVVGRELAAARATLLRLEEQRPGAGRELRARLARALAGAGERPLALETLAPLVRSAAPRELAGLVRVQLELGAVDEALATRRRATALGAEDLETRLALAAAMTGVGRPGAARDELRAAYRLAPEARRGSIVQTLVGKVLPAGTEREAWIGELLRHARAHPLDEWAWCLAADLRLRTDEPRAARDLLDEGLTRGAARTALLWRRARALEALGRSDAALDDLRRARLLGHVEDPDASALEIRALLASGRTAEAATRALASDRPRVVAAILQQHGEREAAVSVLEAARRSDSGPSAELELELGELYLALGRIQAAIGAFERRLQLGPPALGLLERLGDLHYAQGDAEAGFAIGRRLLAASPRVAGARAFFTRHEELGAWIPLACRKVLAGAPNPDVLEELREELWSDPRGVRALQDLYADLSEAARVEGLAPEGWAAPAWALACAEAEGHLLRTWPAVLAGRCEALRERLRVPAPLSGREWIEVAFVAPVDAEVDVERLGRALRRAKDGGELAEPAVSAALARLASTHARVGREFARHAARLADRLDGGELSGDARLERERREIELALARGGPDARDPAWIAVGNVPRGALAWLDPDLLRRHGVIAAAAAGDAELEGVLDAALAEAAEVRLSGLLAQIEAYIARGRSAEASQVLERLAVSAPNGADTAPDSWRRVAAAFVDARAIPEGYTILRRHGRSDAARALVRNDGDRALCVTHFEAESRRALGVLARAPSAPGDSDGSGGSGGSGEPGAEEARRLLHEATTLLLEFLPAGGSAGAGLPSAREAAARALEFLPDDAVLRALLAREEELAGRFSSALEERRRALADLEVGLALSGLVSGPGPAETARAVGVVRRASAWLILESEADLLGGLRLGALRMELELARPGTLETLEGWLAGGTPPGPTTPTLLLHLLTGYDLGAPLADHLAAVFDQYPEHGTLLRELLTVYCGQERFVEARGALDRHLAAVPEPRAAIPRVARLRERVDRLESESR